MRAEATADVAVVGAGPAGSAAAIVLARAGLDVALVDKARFPRDKCCGDGLTTWTLRQLEELGLQPPPTERSDEGGPSGAHRGGMGSWRDVGEVWVRSPGGHQVAFPFPRHEQGRFGAVVKRIELDQALVDLAREAGASLIEGQACTGARQGDDRVIIQLAGGTELSARYVVAADGMWSPVRRHLGLAVEGYRGEWHALRQHFTDVGPTAASELHVWFEPDLLPGYAWSFPLSGNRANVGLGILRGGQYRVGDLAHVWPELLRRPHVKEALGPEARPEAAVKAWPIPARAHGVALAGGRALFVGDAAAATDPMTGEGIGQALATGRWAAEALIFAGPHRSAAARSRYVRSVRNGLLADHHISELLSRVLAKSWGPGVALAAAGMSSWTRRHFARWLFEDEPRAALVTPGRWHRNFLSRPGAFLSSSPTASISPPASLRA